MGTDQTARIDAWLRKGGLVVTASERAARALADGFHRARQAEGRAAWLAPGIQDWKSFVRAAWDAGAPDGRMLLNPTQEQALWAKIAGADGQLATLLDGPRHRLASLAMEAHALLCAYAPRFLRQPARSGWQQDAAAFSGWLAAFDEACRAGNLISPARLPLETIRLLASNIERPPLLLAGFDRLLPVQRALFDAWGEWRQIDSPTDTIDAPAFFHAAADAEQERTACALWCEHQLAANPNARLLVVTQDANAHRGEFERAFLRLTGPAKEPLFEFSLGTPLRRIALPQSAQLLLRWLTSPLAEHALDWLFATSHAAASAADTAALQARMRALRRRGLQQTQWTLDGFLGALAANSGNELPAWAARMLEAQRLLAEFARRPQSPLDWAELVPRLLETAGWPGARPLDSAEFQALRSWRSALEAVGSLGFDGRRIDWRDFVAALARALDSTLFTPESRGAPIQIAGPAESAGLTADAIWFLGAAEDAWPAGGAMHPLLPAEVQRAALMPHATPQLDWDLAHAMTARLIASAQEIRFSYARQTDGVAARPARLIEQFSGEAQPLPPDLQTPPGPPVLTETFADASRIPFPPGRVPGGASVLTAQSQCPFQAFATARLGAQSWDSAEVGLTASQRGQLLHAVLRAVWAGPPDGLRTLTELLAVKELGAFVVAHVQRVLQAELRPALRQRLPRRYLQLEAQRLARLVTAWLEYEATRVPFEVAETEAARAVSIAGLRFDLRLDRIDRLNDGSLLVLDYKSGDVSPVSWELPRPDDVQLPLYAGFALDPDAEALGGLVFAKVRAGDLTFAGRVGDAQATLLASLSNHNGLVRNPLTAEQLIDWRDAIERLAGDFLAGRAEVDPRESLETCVRCGLQTLCRIAESEARIEAGSEEAADE